MRAISEIKAVVTGGASGLGFATAKAIIDGGGKVMLFDINQTQGDIAQDQLGKNATFIKVDITQEVEVDEAFAQSVKEMGEVNLTVNCAGIAPSKRVLGRDGVMSTEEFSKVTTINLNGTFTVARAAANVMQHNLFAGGEGNTRDVDDVIEVDRNDSLYKNERGVIINTASIAAFDGLIGQAAYSASKAGIVGMTLPLAREFARIGVRVVTIAPGLFRTPLFDTLPEKAVAALEEGTPFPSRLGDPAEYAAMVCHIFQNNMMNGETIRLDGALRMS